MAGMLRTIVIRFQRLILLVCEARRDLVDLWREREQLADIGDGVVVFGDVVGSRSYRSDAFGWWAGDRGV